MSKELEEIVQIEHNHAKNVVVLFTSIAEDLSSGARFSKVPETFWARKAIFSSPVSEDGKVYTPETLYEGSLSSYYEYGIYMGIK